MTLSLHARTLLASLLLFCAPLQAAPESDALARVESALADLNKFPENERFVRFGEVTGLYEFFAARGISADQARTCLGDFASLEKLSEASESYGTDDKINQTPTFVLNGSKLDASSWADLEPKLQRAGAR